MASRLLICLYRKYRDSNMPLVARSRGAVPSTESYGVMCRDVGVTDNPARAWFGVALDWEEIADLVADAYRMVAPRKLVALLDESTRA
jgi:hypothetical protein